ncbi:hypothetical protein LQ757_02025 [Agromyces sp. SYSU K20354]|uniref:hypothetical protein n=1 Tax=Agromyces cavernae TaxID=2898659 RepID=UPI001E470D25|nr:hypothetical protein [Agromyces cavernae]MCD2441043.1 hypothetical protein [Agromyces cavernae]
MAHLARTLPALVVLGLALTGCTAQLQPEPSPSPTLTTPAPTTPAASVGIECDRVLGSDGNAKLAADGLEPVEPQLFDPLAVQLEEAGGTACAWGRPQTDIGLTLVQLSVPDAEWAAWETALADAGYAVDSDAADGMYTGPVDPGTGVSTVAVVAGDRITFLNTAVFADLLAPHAI